MNEIDIGQITSSLTMSFLFLKLLFTDESLQNTNSEVEKGCTEDTYQCQIVFRIIQ